MTGPQAAAAGRVACQQPLPCQLARPPLGRAGAATLCITHGPPCLSRPASPATGGPSEGSASLQAAAGGGASWQGGDAVQLGQKVEAPRAVRGLDNARRAPGVPECSVERTNSERAGREARLDASEDSWEVHVPLGGGGPGENFFFGRIAPSGPGEIGRDWSRGMAASMPPPGRHSLALLRPRPAAGKESLACLPTHTCPGQTLLDCRSFEWRSGALRREARKAGWPLVAGHAMGCFSTALMQLPKAGQRCRRSFKCMPSMAGSLGSNRCRS